jgi:subtilisin family serine protease
MYLRMLEVGYTAEMIQWVIQDITNSLEYSYNPDFDSRLIVGDDYNNLTERHYGNSDVRGPDAYHGTHVAGIVGAKRDNNIGMNGVANGVRIMSVRTVPDGDERDKDVANAIRYAVENGANVINMSFGKGFSPQKPVVDEAVRYAMSRGVLMVHAAGNDGEDLTYNESFPTPFFVDGERAELWLEVGASGYTSTGLAASFSNYGSERVDVFAPGVEIYATIPDNEYTRLQGTSMASPVVAGVAGLLMAYYPELTAAQVKQIIMETVTPYQEMNVQVPGGGGMRPFGELSISGGVVNAYSALLRAAEITGGRN